MRIRGAGAVLRELARLFFGYSLARAAAGLSYFLTLSFFPMLILLYQMLGGLLPKIEEIRVFLSGVFPQRAEETVLEFLRYVSENLDSSMLVMALSVLVTSASAAFRCIDKVTAEMRGGQRRSGFFELLSSVLFSLVFLVAIYLSVILVVTGKWFFRLLDRYIYAFNISDSWSWGRFALLFLLLFVILLWLYRITAPAQGQRTAVLVPGAAAASAAIVGVSIAFSEVLSVNVTYPVVYGSLASLMILMFWLYVCGILLFLGSALNIALERRSQ